MKIFFAGFLFLYSLGFVYGQQPAQYSLFMMNEMRYNPGFAGLEHSLHVTAGSRWQWEQLPGAPASQYASAHLPVYFLNGGLGIQIENDELGPLRNLYTGLSYNYQLYVGGGILSLGLGAGVYQRNLDGTLLRTPSGNYESNTAVNHEDTQLPNTNISGTIPTFQFGIYFQNDRLELGVSTINLREPALSMDPITVQLKRNYFLNGSLKLPVNRAIVFRPSFMLKSDVTQTQTDIAALFEYNENLLVGGGLRGYHSNSIDAVLLIAGFKLSEKIRFAYAYDLTLSDLSLVSNGSHEIMINYNLNKRIGGGRPPRIIYNPRNL